MAEKFKALTEKHIGFIGNQHIFFVGTAASEGFVNVSPKGMDSFRVVNNSKVAWLNLTGSGNETAAHILENNRMTIMFCSFDKQPLILRLYGHVKIIHPRDKDWPSQVKLFPEYTGARQIFELNLELVQTSCGYAVPFYELVGERPTLRKWADNRGRKGVEEYWQEKNTKSLDGKDTGIIETV
ncbi:pyridoxamine 5'-phosphate oxidase family protein [uncultured Microbulbifer sp.]|uniref:pyridoxamine 5'-phosphate oxidase family protein n=1 Tax=uncultured Microbulbifer sp. TaxID=348147 RepID=UPI002610D550|nr:pyridoxamine 5'-phosphate oxidase family protein [uncultured Microbulbifer sp.]